ncbi:RHS repeat-associated core domain-containing protein [Sphingobacterium sp. BIGb0116]|uniref:RHS repeat-associated core domain-containing protein n=1 Tax=Sphingobacterium sp. BIGb0116 TaxID=2940619 RepID=UPI00216A1FD2|nr:RHS repeat-associated core domain-containing protein [Sphingobacterium sp. BIGb0116]MCS4165184.1 RHS repeat-associated protein [Sphingobacterium sp. BIGb0116]
MKNRISLIYRYVLPMLVLLSPGFVYGQNNVPNTAQQSVSGNVTNIVPIPKGAYNSFGDPIQVITQLTPKYRDTSSSIFTETVSSDKAGMKTTIISGQGTPNQMSVRRSNNRFVIQPSDIRSLQDVINFQSYSSPLKFDRFPIYESVQYHNTSRYPSEGGAEVSDAGLSASMVRNTSSSTERSSTSYLAGRSRIGQGRGTKTVLISNDGNTGSGLPQSSIRIWEIGSNDLPQPIGYYNANSLKGNLMITAQGGEKLALENSEGNPVFEASLIVRNPKIYAKTYYIYDELGQLRYILPPKAVEAMEAASGIVSQAIIDELCFSYNYDAKGRQFAMHKPGEGRTELIYNKQGQVIMRRSTSELLNDQWEAIFYDRSGRTIATGLVADDNDREYWQNLALTEAIPAANTLNYYLWGSGQYTYPSASLMGTQIQSFSYYDSYESNHPLPNENFSGTLISPFLNTATDAEAYVVGGSTFGLQTSSATRTVTAAGVSTNLQDWSYSKTFYDYEHRPVYTVTQNSKGGKDTMASQYNFLGQILVTAHGHQYGNGTGPSFREWYRNTYDIQTNDLTLSEHKVNAQPWRVMSSTTYDALGRAASITYGTNAETQNFTYNIRGELQGINENYTLTGNNNSQSMTFGEVLRYDYGFDSLRYDGLAAGMIWRGSGAGNTRAHSYGYIYDVAGRMLRGAYLRSNTTPTYTLATGWSNSTNDYSETVTYDQTGNILTLQRRAVVAANQMVFPTNVDNLTFTYFSNSNKIQKVVDATTTNYNRGDYLYTSSVGYSYNPSGSLFADVSKGISRINYTWFDKPSEIVYGDTTKRIWYSYDASGNKIQELVKNGNYSTIYNYIGTAIYKNDTLQSISTPVGRTDMSKGGTQEQYFVKDHLGNVRSVVADAAGTGGIGGFAAQTQTYNATYETANLVEEEQTFDQVSVLSEDKPETINSNDLKAAKLIADGSSTRVGTTLMLKVMTGDKLSLNADNYYESGSAPNTNSVSGTTFEQIVNSLAQAAGQLNGYENSVASDWAAQLLNSSNLQQAYEAMQSSYTDPGKPKAFLNFLYFDERMELVPEFCHIWQADGSEIWSRIGTDESENIEVPQNGFIATYISTESSDPTYFDNLTVTLEPGVLLEEKHYYPYGLPIVGMGSSATGMLLNKNRYQGNEYREDLSLNWMDFHNRQYDPQLGRFLSIDPMAAESGQQLFSPYHAMACNPSTMVDPLGLVPVYMASESMFNPIPSPGGIAVVEGQVIMFGASLLEGGISNMMASINETMEEANQLSQNEKAWEEIFESLGGVGISFKNGYADFEKFDADIKKIHFVFEEFTPEIYKHTVESLKEHPEWSILTYNGGGQTKIQNRRDALRKTPGPAGLGLSWDEFPYAMSEEGGKNARVAAVPVWEQRVQGIGLSTLVTKGLGLKKGDKFFVTTVPQNWRKQPTPRYVPKEKPHMFPDFPVIPVFPVYMPSLPTLPTQLRPSPVIPILMIPGLYDDNFVPSNGIDPMN